MVTPLSRRLAEGSDFAISFQSPRTSGRRSTRIHRPQSQLERSPSKQQSTVRIVYASSIPSPIFPCIISPCSSLPSPGWRPRRSPLPPAAWKHLKHHCGRGAFLRQRIQPIERKRERGPHRSRDWSPRRCVGVGARPRKSKAKPTLGEELSSLLAKVIFSPSVHGAIIFLRRVR